MGTRSLTRFTETFKNDKGEKKKKELVVMYRQYDGYPEGHGKELTNFLKKGTLVNGIGSEKTKVFNGMGCLSAQVISHFKKNKAGGFYIYPAKSKDCGEEFEYEIEADNNTRQMIVRCFEVGYMKGEKYVHGKKLLFEGEPKDFGKFVRELQKKEKTK